ncbi:MAG TPA: hypothetical protein VGN83_15245 [Falsiroseomonas sp.]|jgi:hypothetical protein|nr:hypothetical protein [Falsiroseomonas sp.]
MGGDLWSGEGGRYRAWLRGGRRRRWPWGLAALGVLVAVVVFLAPRWLDAAPGACAAVERRAVRVALEGSAPPAVRAAARALSRQALDGRLAAAVAAERYGWLPAPMGCALAWWRLRWTGAAALGWAVGVRR